MSGTLRESRVRSNSLGKCPDPVKDTQIMEPVEVRDSKGIAKLVVFITVENDNFRNKAKYSYLTFIR